MKKYWFVICIIIGLFVTAALLYPSLPDQIPTHFGLDGTIDKYEDKIHVFSIPAIILILTIVLIVSPRFDPRKDNYRKFSKTYGSMINVFVLFMTGMFGITLYSAYYPNSLNIPMIISLAVGLLFSVIGNMMPKFRWNYFIGIRCPWTIHNEQVWFLTHQLGGKIWMVGGVLIMIAAFLPPAFTMAFVIIIVLAMTMIPTVYAYIKFKQIEEKEND